ncbi:MAG TPA: phytanoyl-CoA dioxygenase family protein [Candidatus Latescibacteria bacterium]|jgi:hypothetical protein|nr:phytanoyl-CoA dioxygenase [Gemmatimonadaceae bacterium]MDP6014576.1 phytanoyl-CoA dioxygenase family protein [Candidatus Latescibacterota bacterium]HJP30238.1 phytanoyl-CoA dioxygenase family protein [Candidatus Latescibacterota bacterium]|tara:strand:- start:629 stop:1459 length:831 start_codon:yes stop_codon:yes gene_type:complete
MTDPAEQLPTRAQLESFERDGYLLVEDALPAEKVADLLTVIASLEARLQDSPHRRQVFGLDIRPLITEDEAFLELMEWPATFPLAVRFLGHWNLQLTTSHLIMVPPNPDQRNTGWHDDGGKPFFAVDGIRPFMSLKVGYFLTDLLEESMGSLMVVPGSHRQPGRPTWDDGDPDPHGVVELKLRAGAAVIFQQGVWHAGAPNLSQKTRVVLYYGYSSRLLRPIDYERMPQEILDRCTPIGRQLLGDKSSHLGYYIPTDDDVPLKPWYIERFGTAVRD